MSASEEGRGVRGGTLLGSHLSVASLRRSTAVTTSCFLFCLVLLLVVGMLLTPVAPVRAGPPQKLYLGPQSAWFKSEGVCPKTVETRDDSNNPAPVDSTTTITVECDRGGLSAGPYGP